MRRSFNPQLKHPVNQQQTYWLAERLYELYDHAIAHDGDVSLGRGADLYRAVEKKAFRISTRPIRTTAIAWSVG